MEGQTLAQQDPSPPQSRGQDLSLQGQPSQGQGLIIRCRDQDLGQGHQQGQGLGQEANLVLIRELLGLANQVEPEVIIGAHREEEVSLAKRVQVLQVDLAHQKSLLKVEAAPQVITQIVAVKVKN